MNDTAQLLNSDLVKSTSGRDYTVEVNIVRSKFYKRERINLLASVFFFDSASSWPVCFAYFLTDALHAGIASRTNRAFNIEMEVLCKPRLNTCIIARSINHSVIAIANPKRFSTLVGLLYCVFFFVIRALYLLMYLFPFSSSLRYQLM